MSTSPPSQLPALGIDIGAAQLHVAWSPDPRQAVEVLELESQDWQDRLIALVPPGATVAYEPTGWHYSAPVVAVLHHIGCTVLQVEHRITGMVRTLRVSGVKKDMTDAQALAYIAATHASAPMRGVHTSLPNIDNRVTSLRMLIWAHVRAVKERTRTANRLRQMAHSVWPALDQKLTVYLRAIRAGAITPAELRGLAIELDTDEEARPTDYNHATRRRELAALVAALPPWLDVSYLRDTIQREAIALEHHNDQVTEIADLINAAIHEEPFAQVSALWSTIPAAGPFWLAALHVATHGHAADLTIGEFKASVGSHPHISQSGETADSSAARQGFKPAKVALYIWTMTLIRMGDNPVAATFERRKDAGQGFGIQAARAKLCASLYGVAKNGTTYNPDQPDHQWRNS